MVPIGISIEWKHSCLTQPMMRWAGATNVTCIYTRMFVCLTFQIHSLARLNWSLVIQTNTYVTSWFGPENYRLQLPFRCQTLWHQVLYCQIFAFLYCLSFCWTWRKYFRDDSNNWIRKKTLIDLLLNVTWTTILFYVVWTLQSVL